MVKSSISTKHFIEIPIETFLTSWPWPLTHDLWPINLTYIPFHLTYMPTFKPVCLSVWPWEWEQTDTHTDDVRTITPDMSQTWGVMNTLLPLQIWDSLCCRQFPTWRYPELLHADLNCPIGAWNPWQRHPQTPSLQYSYLLLQSRLLKHTHTNNTCSPVAKEPKVEVKYNRRVLT